METKGERPFKKLIHRNRFFSDVLQLPRIYLCRFSTPSKYFENGGTSIPQVVQYFKIYNCDTISGSTYYFIKFLGFGNCYVSLPIYFFFIIRMGKWLRVWCVKECFRKQLWVIR